MVVQLDTIISDIITPGIAHHLKALQTEHEQLYEWKRDAETNFKDRVPLAIGGLLSGGMSCSAFTYNVNLCMQPLQVHAVMP